MVRPVPQRRGDIKYAVDQAANQQTITFQPRGIFDDSCLIAGQAGTISDATKSLELFRAFSKTMRNQFSKIQSFYVGEEACDLFEKGWRLASDSRSPALFDLRRD